jgi:cell division protein FtsI/penicillin-binding protein 2
MAHLLLHRKQSQSTQHSVRGRVFLTFVALALLLIVSRLFFWQIIKGKELRQAAERQSQRQLRETGERGKILTSDGHTLVANQDYFRVMLVKDQQKEPSVRIIDAILPILSQDDPAYQTASSAAEQATIEANLAERLTNQLSKESKWIQLKAKVTAQAKNMLADLEISGLTFEPFSGRYYPEASMAAHLLGFVGKNEQGQDIGYFGIEGALNDELAGKFDRRLVFTDALGRALPGQNAITNQRIDGRDLVLTIRRDLQNLAESELERGIKKYGAVSGEIIMVEPDTGKVLAMATWPKYHPYHYFLHETSLYKNPAIVNTYEPGSTFKVLTVAAALDAGVVNPTTTCPSCAGPREIAGYTIKTWNNTYNPNISVTDALAKSDNVAMMYLSDLLGRDRFVEYIRKFGIGDPLGIDLQDDTKTPFPTKWGPVEIATASFGQGISTTSMQLIRAVSAIANGGKLMRPMIIEKVIDHQQNKTIELSPTLERQVISRAAADQTKAMMVNSAHHGEAQWTVSKHHTVAAKTGTSQVAVGGKYDPNKTIASYIGFAPPENPQVLIFVKLNEPQSSIWAAETAAPLWYAVAEKAFLLLNIPADR